MKMNFKNFTPHEINILDDKNNVVRSIAPEGIPIRLSQETRETGNFDGVRITETEFGNPEGLPEEESGTMLIVSRLVLAACPDRNDLCVPNELVRNEKGHIVGCKSLAIN